MATNFRNIVGKDIGTERVAVYTVPAATSTTVIGMNIANLTDSMVNCSIEIGDEASNIGFLVKNMPIAPNTSMKPIGKGEKIVLCLRSKTKEAKLTDINTLMFVLLHELGHIMTVSIGHTKEFWSNFKFILKNAVEINVYHNVDYSKDPQPYCGIEVNDSPLHNSSIE